MTTRRAFFATLAAAVIGVISLVHADGYRKLPAGEKGGQSPFELRVVEYKGSTNGQLLVEVRNTGRSSASFSAEGLYFVPEGNPDQAPQRVGAVGPFQMKTEDGWQSKDGKDGLLLAPGQSAKLLLEVYCIDSHRRSPTSQTKFSVAKTRMPKSLARSIDRDARRSAADKGGIAAPAAKSAVQSEVWKNRDQKWIKLDGEGRQEATK